MTLFLKLVGTFATLVLLGIMCWGLWEACEGQFEAKNWCALVFTILLVSVILLGFWR